MRRAVLFAVLSLLLLSMQQQGHVHPIAHLAGHAPHPQETTLTAPQVDADCVECALLASGTNAVHGESASMLSATAADGHARTAFHSRAADSPSWFHSRAPPVLL
jgi:hypothetical protein